MKKLYFSVFLLLMALFSAIGVKATTQVYLIPQSQLVNCGSSCGPDSYYNGCGVSQPSFTWTDVIPSGATISAVTIDFNIGVECSPGLRTTGLNGFVEPSVTTTINWCSCSGSGEPYFTISAAPADYVIGATNTFALTNPTSCLGYALDATLGAYARVTVEYTTGPPLCATPVVTATPSTACSSPITVQLNGVSAGNNIDWYTASSGGSSLGTVASGVDFPRTISASATYYAEASGSGCVTSARVPLSVTVSSPPSAPSAGSASPATICPGATSLITATSSSPVIDWYSAASGGSLLGSMSSGGTFSVSPSVTTTYYAEANASVPGGTATFNYTGAMQTFTVPAGVTSLVVDAKGGKGGNGSTGTGGNGARVQTTISVSGGSTLNIFVGGAGGNLNNIAGYNGGGNNPGSSYSGNLGGGGGASDIRIGGVALTDRVVVAGGGGAGGYNGCTENGGVGGGTTGGAATLGCGTSAPGGGTPSAGGAGGTYSGWSSGSAGALGVGGNGGSGTGGAGGGGGYYGGGGGAWQGGGSVGGDGARRAAKQGEPAARMLDNIVEPPCR